MKNYKESAELHIKTKHGNDYGLLESSINDSKDLFAFSYQTLKYLESGNAKDGVVGQGYIFISKTDGRIFEYGSRLSHDEAARDLRLKLNVEGEVRKRKPDYDLRHQYGVIIHEIRKRQIFIETILKMGFSFTIPEILGDSIFRISQPYTKKNVLRRLEKLPVTFSQVNKDDLLSALPELIKNESCQFELTEIEFPKQSNYLEGDRKINLEPIW